MAASTMVRRVAQVRRFNRFYTRRIGVLHEHLLDSPFSLTEVRVLYELAHRQGLTAVALSSELGLDPGYLSRMLRSFEHKGLVARTASRSDARQSLLSLTPKGRAIFRPLDRRSDREVASMLNALTASAQSRLLRAMSHVEQALQPSPPVPTPYTLRSHRPGDMGWIVHRHGALYSEEYGYDERFEALVAEIVAHFIQNLDPARERCWIAERDDEFLGCIFVVRKSKSVCKLRLLLVEPGARGLGLGRRLVRECIDFARKAGYRKMMLWTQSELHAARHLYEQAGFTLVEKSSHNSWGRKSLVAETWQLKL